MPKTAVKPMTASDVPAASFGSNPAATMRSGTTTIPPPTPKSAPKKPPASPIAASTATEGSARATRPSYEWGTARAAIC